MVRSTCLLIDSSLNNVVLVLGHLSYMIWCMDENTKYEEVANCMENNLFLCVQNMKQSHNTLWFMLHDQFTHVVDILCL